MIFGLFKNKKEIRTENFSSFLENSSEEKFNRYLETIPIGKEFDYTFQCWGHAFTLTKSYKFGIHYGHGFHTAIFGTSQIKKGDILLLKSSGGIGKYIVLNIAWERDPNDMFWAYIGCIGYKE